MININFNSFLNNLITHFQIKILIIFNTHKLIINNQMLLIRIII